MRFPVGVIDRAVEDHGCGEVIALGADQNRLAPGLTDARHGDPGHVGLRHGAQIGDDCVGVGQDDFVIEVATVVAIGQRLAVTGEARKIVGHDGHIAGFDVLLAQVQSVLHDAVALVHMDNDRPFADTFGDAEMGVDALVDFYRCEHGRVLCCVA